MKKFWIFAAMVLCLTVSVSLTGCISRDAIKIHEIENISVSMRNGIMINAIVRVENSAGRNIKISDIQFEINDLRGNGIGGLSVDEELIIPRRSETNIAVPLKVKLNDPLSGMRLFGDLASAADKIFVTGSVRLKSGMFSKKITFEDVSLSEIMTILDHQKILSNPIN